MKERKILQIGEIAPDLALKDKRGKTHSLGKIKAKNIVLYFYPKDNTPGCTIEANQFNNDLNKYKKIGTVVIGISGGDEKSKTKFCAKNNLKTLLLSDSNFNISSKYGVYAEKSFLGKKHRGIERTTFILDKNKKIIKIFTKVNPLGHSSKVLEYLSADVNSQKNKGGLK
jgi:thioredoxin-dependent peroxiredoxin